ncbi:MAG: ubiquinone-dependent pyruvate dehydrogenase [Bifidobacteriaceae bacterium]|jgi:pyruvate dehydrogenase (quinone)|nr:ubiquinone-dependent pyruvate dehydrogenase [Bifidobacteriaceae bacterium]
MGHTVADQMWEMLANAGVSRCYGIVGDALNPVVDALRRDGRIELIHVRHEEYGAFAATAEAQITGQPVAVCGTAGPGGAHLINGLLDAKHEGAPVIAIAGDVERAIIDTGGMQGLNPYRFFEEASLYTGRLVSSKQARAVIQTAIDTAVIGQGPTVISVPGDVASAKAETGWSQTHPPQVDSTPPTPPEADVAAMAEMINRSEAVTIYAGHGCRDAVGEVAALAEMIKAPVGYTFRGKELLEAATPNAVGMTGLLGWGGAYDALHSADLILLLGADFPFPGFLPDEVPAVQVDKAASHIGRRMPVVLGLVGDVGATLRALAGRVAPKGDDTHLRRHLRQTEHWRDRLRHHTDRGSELKTIRPEYLASVVSDLADEDAIFTVDTGTPCMWVARHVAATGRRRVIGSLSWASMACAAPYGLGAALAAPGRQVVAMCGDGGFTMLALGDLITQVRYGARVVHVVFDNQQLDFVNIEQQEAGMIPFGTGMANPDLAAVAQALGAHGIRLTEPGDVRETVAEALAWQGGPVVIDAVVDPVALELPSHIPGKVARGFTLSSAKRVFAGQLPELAHELADNVRVL